MKRILPEFEFSDEQLNSVRKLAAECGLCVDTVKILYGRGLRDSESIYEFMHPSKEHFISPFKMSGMRGAVDLITRARDEEWSVVVYGDYDADGICAATILGNALKDFGIEPYVCVPERNNGYGLSQSLIDEIFDEYFPQLFITVDCGISCAAEVEYIKEMGAEVIVTDHHELPDNIPDCLCINPKFNDGYIYDNLCGAGVAFKLACALNGEDSHKYLDLAAIATVADSVPLTGENRDIVCEGLKLINKSPRAVYSGFLSKNDSAVTAHTLAFSIAPKINAAGRMGDAKAALDLFSAQDEKEIYDLTAKLTAYNLERQKCCDDLYLSAKRTIKERGGVGNIIMLCNEEWNSGFVGIVAARLADEYSRPAILFVKNGNTLKGSARSVDGVNIFEALKSCSEFIEEFGGHSQAAGVNVLEENFDALCAAMEKYVSERYSVDDLVPTVLVNGELVGEYSTRLAKELEMLEPCGVGNRRPMFVTEERALPVSLTKAQSAHLAIKSKKIDLMYFGGSKFAALLESEAPKKLVFEYNISTFRGKEYVKGFVRDVIYDDNAGGFAGESIALNGIDALSADEPDCKITEITKERVQAELNSCGSFGTLFIAWDYDTVKKFNTHKLHVELFAPSTKNCASCVLLAPAADADLSGFARIIFMDWAFGVNILSLSGKSAEVCKSVTPAYFNGLSTDRQKLLEVFALLSANESNLVGANPFEVSKNINSAISKQQILFAIKVFEELALVDFSGGSLKICRGKKTELTNSVIYNKISALKAGEEV